MDVNALAHLITELTEISLALNPRPRASPSGPVWQYDYPDIQGKGEDSKNKNYFKDLADQQAHAAAAAIDTASHPDELEQRRRDRVLAIDKWDMGESGPKAIRNLPGADTSIALYNDARNVHDAGRIGKGYSTLSDGANPNFSASLDKQNELERGLAASGELENNINNTLEGNKAEMYGLSSMGNQRNMSIAGMKDSDYNSSLSRYLDAVKSLRQPNFFRQLAMQFAGGVGQGLATPAP